MQSTSPSELADRTQRAAVAFAVAGSAALVLRSSLDVFALPKATAVALAGIVACAAAAWSALRTRRFWLPTSSALIAMLVFLAIGALSVFTADSVWRAVVGQRERSVGYGLYVVAALLLVCTMTVFREVAQLKLLVRAVVAAAGLVALYCLMQWAGLDPLSWPAGSLPLFSTMGNSNFVSGYLGAALPLSAYLMIADEDQRWRIVGTGVGLASVLAILETRSFQGIPAAGGGMAVLAIGWLPTVTPAIRRWFAAAAVVGVVGFAVITAAGLSGSGPFKSLSGEAGFAQRQYYWSAAVSMTADHPVLGVGFDGYAGYFRAYRSEEAANLFGLSQGTDEPHDVPLGMFAGGGVPLGLAYLAFVGSVGAAALRGLRRTSGAQRLLLSAIAGAWAGYQVQSLVSIENPALIVLHWVLAGAVLAASGTSGRKLFGAPEAQATVSRRGKVKPARQNLPIVDHRMRVAEGTLALVAIALAWCVTVPLRADVHAKNGATAVDVFGANTSYRAALGLAPWESTYWVELGRAIVGNGQPKEALRLFEEAAHRDPRGLGPALTAARAARAADEPDTAEKWYRRALVLEPKHWELQAEVGHFYVTIGKPETGLPMLERAIKDSPSTPPWYDYGEALIVTGDREAGVEAMKTALGLKPGDLALMGKVADVYATAGLDDEAISVLREIVDAAPDAPRPLGLLGQLLVRNGELDEGIKLLEHAVELDPTNAELTSALNAARAQAGNP